MAATVRPITLGRYSDSVDAKDDEVTLLDNKKIYLGNSNDLEIYHNGTHSFIDEKGTGNLYLSSADELQLRRYATNEKFIRCIGDGAVEIYHDNEKVFETADNGIKVLNTDGNGTLSIIGSEGNDAILQFKADDGDDPADHWRIVGDADGSLYIQNWTASAWETNIKATGNGAVVVYYDGSVKFETNTNGCLLGDNSKIQIGGGADLQIYHDGTHSYITNATNALKIKGDLIRLNSSTGDEMMLAAHLDGAVELYHNNVKRLETTDAGIKITGQSKGVCTKNLLINGAMLVYQRNAGAAYTGATAYVLDRWAIHNSGTNEHPTVTRHDIAAADATDDPAWEAGFRHSFHIQNGNQTSTGAGDYMGIRYHIEARDIRNCGWDFKSSSSYMTLSFWVKSSVAQNFYGYIRSQDGTAQRFAFQTGSLTANTWTKVTTNIPGNSNISIDDNKEAGLSLFLHTYWGTNNTDSGVSLETWGAYSSSTRTPDYADTWWTTDDATFEVTGLQLEVGKVANDYKHQTQEEVLLKCQRYYWELERVILAHSYNAANKAVQIFHPVVMRTTPTETITAGVGSFTSYQEHSRFWSAYVSAAHDAVSAVYLSKVVFDAEL